MAQPDFWKDPKQAQEVIAALKEAKGGWEPWTTFEKSYRDLEELSGALEETAAQVRRLHAELMALAAATGPEGGYPAPPTPPAGGGGGAAEAAGEGRGEKGLTKG